MRIVFIADAHLKGLEDPGQKTLIKFLDNLKKINTLVILGDLFDFWTGSNSAVEGIYRPALDALKRLRDRGAKIIYLEGNHDFSMGKIFTDTLGAQVYPDSTEMVIDEKRYYLSHGDTIKMTSGYRLWRAYLRSGLFRSMASIAGPKNVLSIARALSNKSRNRTQNSDYNSTEAALREFAKAKIENGFDGVILGHSHAPGITKIGKGEYLNPGSITNQKSYLLYENGRFRVEKG